MNFESQIQQWKQIDTQLKQLNDRVKELREKRNMLEESITKYATLNNLSKTPDGKMKFVNTRVPEPLTFKYLERSLGEIIKNENQVKLILEHIKQKREIKTITEIKQIHDKII